MLPIVSKRGFVISSNPSYPSRLKYTGELWSKFPFRADKVEKATDSNRDCGKYDIYIISRISNLHKYNGFTL